MLPSATLKRTQKQSGWRAGDGQTQNYSNCPAAACGLALWRCPRCSQTFKVNLGREHARSGCLPHTPAQAGHAHTPRCIQGQAGQVLRCRAQRAAAWQAAQPGPDRAGSAARLQAERRGAGAAPPGRRARRGGHCTGCHRVQRQAREALRPPAKRGAALGQAAPRARLRGTRSTLHIALGYAPRHPRRTRSQQHASQGTRQARRDSRRGCGPSGAAARRRRRAARAWCARACVQPGVPAASACPDLITPLGAHCCAQPGGKAKRQRHWAPHPHRRARPWGPDHQRRSHGARRRMQRAACSAAGHRPAAWAGGGAAQPCARTRPRLQPRGAVRGGGGAARGPQPSRSAASAPKT